MRGNQLAPFSFGRTWTASELNLSWLEDEWFLRFLDPNSSNGRTMQEHPFATGSTTTRFPTRGNSCVRLMKNATGGVIQSGALVIAAAANYPSEIADETATGEVSCGVVDPFLGTTVANGSYCIVIVEGMCKYKLPAASASVTALDRLLPHATEDGRITPVGVPADATAALANALACVGRVLETSDVEDALVIGWKRRQF